MMFSGAQILPVQAEMDGEQNLFRIFLLLCYTFSI